MNGQTPLSADWTEHIDEKTGASYYWNEKTNTSQWECPVATVASSANAPQPEAELEGNVHDRSSPAATIRDSTCSLTESDHCPKKQQTPLAADWTEHTDDNTGVKFYWNFVTNESQWERPVVSKPAVTSSPSLDELCDEMFRHRIHQGDWCDGILIDQIQEKTAAELLELFELSEVHFKQVENFREKERRRKRAGKKQAEIKYVTLNPSDVVHFYLSAEKRQFSEPLPSAMFQQPFKEDMKEKLDENGLTYATRKLVKVDETGDEISEKNKKRVTFIDKRGTLYSGESNATFGENNTTSTWIYIDRNMSGFSLYEYAPKDKQYAAFASSRFGELHLKEASEIEQKNQKDQQERLRDADTNDTYEEEEQILNKLLIDAGVKPYQLR
jgi:hypothetical protein